jgi:hypothetical protein
MIRPPVTRAILFLVGIVLLMISCNSEKRITKQIKKFGPKEAAIIIAKNWPEYLRADTQYVEKTVTKEVQVKVPEYIHDTTLVRDTINDCNNFSYSDRSIELLIKKARSGKTQVKYVIKEKIVKDTVQVEVRIPVPCPPCPQQAVLEKALADLQREKDKPEFWKHPLFWIPWLIIFIAFFVIYFFKGKQ